ncbi:hypothetical protein SAMN05421820_11159 [Pedobacter steynii]|uniref:Uncharacterized protein n=1 Tax=Pedobacter steynii TaxID=430522 RepID=A0A1H0G6M9_9SPHI|nr:hypothetical protein [Pedobacter steynii]NQX42339.1 hypothetical protein [Pedobacter steynii]SDO02538.1 hypothetical protein SAMN05421820_11159 [Pedobacter steynii]
MMLEAFTWQQFLIAALILSVVWYVGVGLLYYKTEISNFLSGEKGKSSEPLPHGWQNKVDTLEDNLIGASVQEHGVSIVEADDFSFLPRELASSELDPLGELADVQQEIKSICAILEQEDGSKEDFFSLFAMIRNKYPKVASSGLAPELKDFIREHAPFHLSAEELENLWV